MQLQTLQHLSPGPVLPHPAQSATRISKAAELCRQQSEQPAAVSCASHKSRFAEASHVCRAVLEEGSTRAEDAPAPKANSSRVSQDSWMWNDFKIRYQQCGTKGPAVVLIHGFGGNADHWRKNTPVLGEQCRVFAIDLLGYGFSDKPDPRTVYTFDNWARQVLAFIDEIVGEPAFLICNSVGGLAALQAAIDCPEKVRGVQLLDISLRMLHIRNQPAWKKPLVKGLQNVLRNTPVGGFFFKQVAKPKTVMNILKQAYGDNKAAVNDELVQVVLDPGLQPGAASVFLDFISYSDGPLPDELLEACTRPVSILWGDKDPWEPIADGKKFSRHACVEEFIPLQGVGHCGMDEAPEMVNPLTLKFIERHS